MKGGRAHLTECTAQRPTSSLRVSQRSSATPTRECLATRASHVPRGPPTQRETMPPGLTRIAMVCARCAKGSCRVTFQTGPAAGSRCSLSDVQCHASEAEAHHCGASHIPFYAPFPLPHSSHIPFYAPFPLPHSSHIPFYAPFPLPHSSHIPFYAPFPLPHSSHIPFYAPFPLPHSSHIPFYTPFPLPHSSHIPFYAPFPLPHSSHIPFYAPFPLPHSSHIPFYTPFPLPHSSHIPSYIALPPLHTPLTSHIFVHLSLPPTPTSSWPAEHAEQWGCSKFPIPCVTVILCAVNERVIGHACFACPAGTTNAAGDDATGADTTCDGVSQRLCVASFGKGTVGSHAVQKGLGRGRGAVGRRDGAAEER